MKLIDKILKFFGLKKKEPVVQKEDQVNYDEMKKFNDEEPIKQDEELDDLNKEIIKNIPPINIVPIPTIKRDEVDLDQFDKEVKKYEEEKKKETKEVKKPATKNEVTPKKKQIEKPVEKTEVKKEVQVKKRRPKKQVQKDKE